MLTRDGKSLLFDEAPISKMRMTREGYLVADVKAARSGIYTYKGSEVGMPDKDFVRVYRPPETVFDKKTMSSFTSLDVTDDHPDELVDSTNWKKYAVGHTGEDIARDGDFIRVPLIVRDENTISKIRSGKRGLSYGYTCDVEPKAGKTPDGQEYDAIQTNLNGNHLAICDLGRAGSECMVGDSNQNKETSNMPGENLKQVIVDGIPVMATDASAMVIDTLQGRIRKANEDNLKLVSDHAQEVKARDAQIKELEAKVQAKDAELGTKDAELKVLKDKANDATSFDAQVAERVELLTRAKGLGLKDEEVKGKTNQDVVKLAVSRKMGDSAIQGKSDDYIRACFDFLSQGHSAVQDHDPLAEAVKRSGGISSGSLTDEAEVEKVHKQMVADMESAWKNPPARVN
jgi:hypothetical protein